MRVQRPDKPAWALSAAEAEEVEEADVDDLLSFAQNLDFDKCGPHFPQCFCVTLWAGTWMTSKCGRRCRRCATASMSLLIAQTRR